MTQPIKYILAVVSCLLSLPLFANQQQQPVHIESDFLRIEEKQGTSYFNGNVKFKQGDLVILANSIKTESKNGSLNKVVMMGKPVKMDQKSSNNKPITASANKIEYFADTEMVHLYGNALLHQGQQQFSGEHIKYNSRRRQVIANGKPTTNNNNGQGRVKAVIMPKSKTDSK